MKILIPKIAVFVMIVFLSPFSLIAGETIEVRVDGLSCMFCAYSLERNFNKLDKLEDIDINVRKGEVTLKLKYGTELSDEEIEEIVKNSGFTPRAIMREEN